MSETALGAIKPSSRTGLVLEALRRGILSGELPAGRPLVEAELASRFGVSKTPVREALKVLSGAGLVTMSDYSGATVRPVDERLTRSVFDARCLIEPVAVQRSVEAGLRDGGQRARQALEAADTAADEVARSLANRDFHRALYADCDNDVLVGVLDQLREQTALISVNAWSRRPSWEDEADEHRQILEAALSGRADEAARLVLQHISAFKERALRQIKEVSRGAQ
ncbi:GntR family transcriptional regulator [Actinoallomurus purpureus]|uniref:GntR family transcriptional regulator n=1 Tax=Actinoallomurus purpureus TaxID=478114 RepID=UPI00209255AA|nr:GntR family transcriptional regulator [Actinoallomurus purpureus]MCO6005425.1 GntR family transcriptional regulator [Actinoallomurus purpureus]